MNQEINLTEETIVRKIYWDNQGWLFDRGLDLNENERDETRSKIVDEDTFWKTMWTPTHHAWKMVNGELINVRDQETPVEEIIENIRNERDNEVFPIINRGPLWHETLTDQQRQELRQWYKAWLDAPKTLQMPTKPQWLI